MTEEETVVLIVHGIVQGVGYRAFVKSVADRVGNVTGRVKNAEDGSVHVLARGNKRALDTFIEYIRAEEKTGQAIRGRTGPIVFHIDIKKSDPEKFYGKKVEAGFVVDK